MPDHRLPGLWNSLYFWFIVIGIAAFKAATSTSKTPAVMALAALAAIFSAMAFSEPVVAYFRVAGTPLEYGVVALVCLTGEHVMRLIVVIASDPSKGFSLWREWQRGGRGDAK